MLSLVDALELRLGSGFIVDGEVARGGMSRIYSARHAVSQQRIAVKVMVTRLEGAVVPQSSELEDRFLLEMRILQKLRHPRIPPVLDAGEVNGMMYFTMPFIDGESLRQRLDREGALPLRDALLIARDVADTLVHAHGNGVVHRDVTPGNLLLSPHGVFLLDFGIAHARSLGEPNGHVDGSGYFIGTRDYESPERMRGRRAEDSRSDLFSLGCVLFEMLAGRTPFRGGLRRLMRGQVRHVPLDVDALPASLPEGVVALLRRSLALDASGRFATASMMCGALDSAIERLPAA